MLPCYIEGALPYTGWFQHGSCHTATVVAFSIANVYFFVTCPHRKTTGHLCEHTSSYQNLKTTLLYVDKYKYIYIWMNTYEVCQETHFKQKVTGTLSPFPGTALASACIWRPLDWTVQPSSVLWCSPLLLCLVRWQILWSCTCFLFFFLKDTNQTQTCTVSG